MTTIPTHIARRSRLLAAALALAAVFVFAVAFSFVHRADAGVFTINACQADRASYATAAFDDRATRGMSWRRACNPLGPGLRGLVTANVARKGRVARGAYSAFVLDAPPGTAFSELRWSGHARRHDCRYALQLYAIRPGADPVAIRNIRANRNCPHGRMAQASGWPAPRSYGVDGATRIVQRTICVGAARPGRRFCSARGRNYIRTFTAEVVVTDPAPPVVSVLPDSPLVRGEWVAGVQSLGYDASDNTGVRSAHALLGGIPRGGHVRQCSYALRVPCPNGPGRIEIETQRVSEGTQSVQVIAEDAAANQAASAPVTVRIDNTPPGTVATAAEGGEGWRNRNGFDIGWINPPEADRAPITTAHYRLCAVGGKHCETGSRQAMGIERIGDLAVPGAGEWEVRLWREDAATNQQPANASLPVRLRFDPEPPEVSFQPLSATDPTRIAARAVDRVSGVAQGRIEIGQTGTGTWHELPTTLQGEQLTTRIDDAALPAGDYTLRVSATDRAANQATSDRLADGRLMQVRFPLRVQTQIRVGVAEKHKVRRIVRRAGKRRAIRRTVTLLVPEAQVRFGQRVRLAGRLTDTGGAPIPDATLNVYAAPRFGAGQHVATLATDENGRYSHLLRPATTHALRVVFPGTALILPTQGTVQVRVTGTSSLKVSRRRVLNGGQAVFRGQVRGRSLPSVGKLVEMQVRLTGGWQTFRTTRTDPDGRWQVLYRFSRTCGTQRFAFRARLPTESGWPVETGASRPKTVTVKGQPCR